jgi:phosphoenolpyruvate carboxykinase (GTP)
MRVLRWIIDECGGGGAVREAPIGLLPAKGAIDTQGLSLNGQMDELLAVSQDEWRKESQGIGEFFVRFGDRLPGEMERQRVELAKRLG